MKSIIIKLLLTVAIAIGLFTVLPAVSRAQGKPRNLDILFLIDQSSTMGGTALRKASDPLGLRFFAPRFAMQWLGSDRLFIHQESNFRMAVIYFGTTAQLGMNWQTIAPNTSAEWATQRPELENLLLPGELAEKSLGNTNFIDAFTMTQQYFENLSNDTTTTDHQKVIVILSDGAPYLDTANFSLDAHLDQVRKMVQNSMGAADGFRIYAVEIDNEDSSVMGPFWEEITGQPAYRVTSDAEIGVRFQEILQSVTSDFPSQVEALDKSIEPGPILVNPFLQSLNFTFFKSALDQTPKLIKPDNTPLSNSDTKYEILGDQDPIEVWTIYNPEPGEWRLEFPSDSLIKSRQVFAKPTLIVPPGPHTEYVPITIEFVLTASDGSIVPSHSWVPNISSIVMFNEQSQFIEFRRNDKNGYYWGTFVPLNVGTHEFSFSFNPLSIEGQPLELYQVEDSFDVNALHIEPNIPAAVYQYMPLDVTLSFEDAAAQVPVWADDYRPQVTGRIEDEELTLTEKTPGQFSGSFLVGNSGEQSLNITVEMLDVRGNVIATLVNENKQITVYPSQRVHIVSHNLKAQVSQTIQNSFPFIVNTPWRLDLELRDENDDLVNLTDITEQSSEDIFQISIQQNGNNIETDKVSFENVDGATLNIWGDGLREGEFQIQLIPNPSVLKNGFVWEEPLVSIILQRVKNPLVQVAQIGAGILVSSIIIGIVVSNRRKAIQNRRSVNPCTGLISIQDPDNRVLWSKQLDSSRSNYIVFGRRDLSMLTRIQRLTVHQSQESTSVQPKITVDILLDTGLKIKNMTLSVGDRYKLSTYDLWLVYDDNVTV